MKVKDIHNLNKAINKLYDEISKWPYLTGDHYASISNMIQDIKKLVEEKKDLWERR